MDAHELFFRRGSRCAEKCVEDSGGVPRRQGVEQRLLVDVE
jgi:hypothetical protein